MHGNLEDDDTSCMSDWGGSMTPPLSDSENDILVSQCVAPQRKGVQNEIDLFVEDYDMIPKFNCNEPGNGFTNAKRLNVLQRIIDKTDPYPSCFESSSVSLFGWKIPTAEGLFQSCRRKLFLLCRQCLFRLNTIVATPGKVKTDPFYKCIMNNCVDFMAYTHLLIHRNVINQRNMPTIGGYNNVIDATISEIDLLLTSIGRIQINSPLRNFITLATPSITKSDIKELINHTTLAANWFYLAILMDLCLHDNIANEKKVAYVANFENHCTKVIWDLVLIAFKVFKKDRNSTLLRHRGSQISLFPCTCCVEIILSVIKMADEISCRENCQEFWSLFTGVCSKLQASSEKSDEEKDNPEVPEDVSFDEPIAFSWWLLKEIAPLYKYDVSGRLVHKEGMFLPSNWLLAHDLLRETFRAKQELDVDEEFARECLRSCIHLAVIWNPKADIITYLWEYYHKKLNARFSVGNQGVLNIALPSLTALQLVEKFSFFKHEKLVERAALDRCNSFELFLHLLAVSLQKSTNNNDQASLWGQLKGRFYSKFHKKRMEEFTDIGLQNFTCLFLVLASCVETENMVEKFCSFLSLVQMEKLTQSMSLIMIKGLYAMLNVQLKLKLSTPMLTEKLRWNFDYTCRNFIQRHHDHVTRRNNWQLISLHFDCIEELFESSDTSAKEVPFFSVGDTLSNVFNKASDPEARRISSFVYRLLSSVKIQNHTVNAADSFVWSGLYTWMQKSFLDKQLIQRIPESIADPAAGFTLLSIYRSDESNMVPTFNELVKRHVAFELPARFTAKYLSHLLSSSSAIDKIVAEDLQSLVIQTWLRCLISLTEKNQMISEMSRHIIQLPAVKELVEKEVNTTFEADDVVFVCIISLGKRQSNASQLSEMVELRQKAKSFFGSILRNTENLLSTGNPIDSLRLLYSIIGKLVKYCSKLIYTKTSPDCLLPKILDQMVLPHQSSKRTIPASVNNCLYGHIHQFLQGLSALDFKKDEFIRRKIKEIFNRYFLLMIKRWHTSPTSKNPFLVALQTTFAQEVPTQASDFRQFIIDIISESFLVLPQPPDNHSAVLYFIMRLFQKSHNSSEIVRNSPSIIMQIMCSLISCDACGGANNEPPGIRHPAMDILTQMIKAYKTASKVERTQLLEKLQNVMVLNIHQFQGIVFKSYEIVAKLDKDLSKDLIKTAIEAVENNENARGCGKDANLRNSLEGFITCVDN